MKFLQNYSDVLAGSKTPRHNVFKALVAVCMLAGISVTCLGQEVSDKMVAPDSSVVFSVSRVNGEIFVEMDFAKGLVFDHVTVERKPEFQTSFSQCLYIGFNQVNPTTGTWLKRIITHTIIQPRYITG